MYVCMFPIGVYTLAWVYTCTFSLIVKLQFNISTNTSNEQTLQKIVKAIKTKENTRTNNLLPEDDIKRQKHV